MTEAEWLTGTNIIEMLDILGGRASKRKLRLFACACCRRIPGYLESEPGRRGLELTERDVDGQATDDEFDQLREEVADIRWYRRDPWDSINRAVNAAWSSAWDSLNLAAASEDQQTRARIQVIADLAGLVREIFGNPFSPVFSVPSWLTWNDGAVRKMAQVIYDDRRFADLPILADALEDAGCADAAILGHCRGGGEHVRGCWVIDLLLGKE